MLILPIFLSLISFNNAFADKIYPGVLSFMNSYASVTNEDHRLFLIYDEPYKINHPEDYHFLNHTIKFLAFKVDSTNNEKSSIVMYVLDDGSLISHIKGEFGNYYSTATTTGAIQQDSSMYELKYQSMAWKKDGYSMLVASHQQYNSRLQSKDSLLIRIWIRKLKDIK